MNASQPPPGPAATEGPSPAAEQAWWKSAVVYQVYPRSFADSDGDGIGDLRGIIEHLDHLSDLGVDVLWLCPVYRSPQDDNGYDISDYQDVDPVFGTLDDLDELLADVHRRGMRLIMDLVVNHTSDEHPWFVESRSGPETATADWYIWRDPRPGTVPGTPGSEPNNWGSFFGGPAWQWVPERGQYYLHLFSAKQPDLNWENARMRAAVFAMMTWWLDRGVDGFRMDVINFISKDPDLPDGPLTESGFGDGTPFFCYGPRVHEHLAEMRREVFDSREGAFLAVGEMPGVTPDQARRFTDAESGQLSMVFQFEHVDLDHESGHKWTPRRATVADLKQSLGRWQTSLERSGWNSLYWNNHDQPRVVSRFGNDTVFWYESATALATVLHLHRGTPYVYQGEELGMTNVPFTDISQFRDIESLSYYRHAVEDLGLSPDVVLGTLRRKSRDNARTPMQWTAGPAAGFTTGQPWIEVNPNHVWLNADAQRSDPRSVHSYYQQLIALRHSEPAVVHGAFTMLHPEHPVLYAFHRTGQHATLYVVANLSDAPLHDDDLTDELATAAAGFELLLRNYVGEPNSHLAPWEARIYRARRVG